MKYKDQLILLMTDEQISAIKSIERAFKKAKRANLYIHNNYGFLHGYNGYFVKDVDDTKTDIFWDEIGISMNLYGYNLDSWSDDDHYVHLDEHAVEREVKKRKFEREVKKMFGDNDE